MLNMSFNIDPLTEIPNFFGLIDSDLKNICKGSGIIAAFDLTGLDAVNIKYGWDTGDIYIKCLASSILYAINNEGIKDRAYPCRVGGDEFVLILPEYNESDASLLTEKINEYFNNNMNIKGFPYAGFRLAIIPYSEKETSVSQILRKVIIGLSEVKFSDKKTPDSCFWVDIAIKYMTCRVQDTLALLRHTHSIAMKDEITGLQNHRAAELYTKSILKETKANDSLFSLLFIDGDNLKQYNEFGYSRGNQMIRELGQVIHGSLRSTDSVFRWLSGDEFLVLLPGTGKNDAVKLGERVRQNVQEKTGDWPYPITVSIGVSGYPDDGQTFEELINKVETANSAAKRSGKNIVICSA